MKKVIWSIIDTFVGRGFSLLWAILLGNLILPQDMGIFVSMLLVVNYTVNLAFIKLDTGTVQRINSTDDAQLKAEYFTWGFLLVLSIAITAIILVVIFKKQILGIFNLNGDIKEFSILIPLILLRALRNYFDLVLTAVYKFKQRTIINLSGAIIQIICGVTLILMGYSLGGVIFSMCLSNLMVAAGMGFVCFKRFGFRLNDKKIAINLVKFSSIIYVASIAVFLDKNIDLFFVNYYLPKDNLAVYNYALQFALVLNMFGNSISHVSFPLMSKYFAADDRKKINDIYKKSVNFSYFILSIPVLLVGVHINSLIRMLLPDYYLNMVISLGILVSIMLVRGAFASVGAIFTANDTPHYGLVLNWSSMIINVLLLYLLVPRYGYVGAAIATASSFGIRLIGSCMIIEYKIGTDYKYLKIILSHIAFLLFLYTGYITQNYIFKTAIILVYVNFMIFVFLTTEDRTLILTWIKMLKKHRTVMR